MFLIQLLCALIFGVGGALMMWMALKSKNETFPRNDLSGYRTQTIQFSDETWKAAHKASWPYTAAAGILLLIGAPITLLSNTTDDFIIRSLTTTILVVVVVFSGGYVAQKTAKTVKSQQQ
ncbi:hypothetical protein BSR29_02350 [Boudabousia liubingyangii]|uniref:SdpI family protein n=1 Tax=Boudabousia liubingyangii TaxID=1921764 RepID=A0A1Q5PQR0_9ACTO|nr:SdpI family protein [Boudabousia liubingyangii]OKL48162.1 hypothetical protein BSR28_00135 [Boudabousia liubingyangii]OKL49809.1 hypothetical protein BSR29_02350 [Boudabousia liubingyangii]